VDWWILYKLPHRYSHSGYEPNSRESFLEEGLAYVYLTSAQPDTSWTLSHLSIGDPASLPGLTLAPLYHDPTPDMFNMMWNDEHPHGPTSFTKGHTKGLVAGDMQESLWLVHSVPHYPPYTNESYGYPHTGQKFGQTALCITLDNRSLDKVGTQLQYNNPFLYSVNIPDWLSTYPSLVDAGHGRHVKKAPFFSVASVRSKGGANFTSFAKYTRFGKDLYADLVAPMLRVPLLVETWPNGVGKMPSRCEPPFIVENVDEMDFHEVEEDDFTTRHDHSKWAVSLDRKRPWVCVGDINRMYTQLKRGGGTVCFAHSAVWATFRSAVKSVEECPR